MAKESDMRDYMIGQQATESNFCQGKIAVVGDFVSCHVTSGEDLFAATRVAVVRDLVRQYHQSSCQDHRFVQQSAHQGPFLRRYLSASGSIGLPCG